MIIIFCISSQHSDGIITSLDRLSKLFKESCYEWTAWYKLPNFVDAHNDLQTLSIGHGLLECIMDFLRDDYTCMLKQQNWKYY